MSNVVMGEEAKAAFLEAINLVADAVEGTLDRRRELFSSRIPNDHQRC